MCRQTGHDKDSLNKLFFLHAFATVQNTRLVKVPELAINGAIHDGSLGNSFISLRH